jgi:hypothetical protein
MYLEEVNDVHNDITNAAGQDRQKKMLGSSI